MKHIMLDLETLDSGSRAAVVALGACVFDPYSFAPITEKFYLPIDPDSAIRAGGTVSGSTIKWWMQQSDDARKQTFGAENPWPIQEALTQFDGWLRGQSIDYRDIAVWGNGATFDNVVIRAAYKMCSMKPFWHYRGDKCYRTVINLLREEARPGFKRHGTAHSALDDAITQARYLQECTKLLGLHADG